MHQQLSYPDMHTPFYPNHCVDIDSIISADRLGLALNHYADIGDQDRYIHYTDVLESALYVNGVLGICMKKSLEAFLANNGDTK